MNICWFGWHKWDIRQHRPNFYVVKQWRYCLRCEKVQIREALEEVYSSPFGLDWINL
jgi:hypothetical protein